MWWETETKCDDLLSRGVCGTNDTTIMVCRLAWASYIETPRVYPEAEVIKAWETHVYRTCGCV